MGEVFSKRNALLGWLVWKLAKRRLRAPLESAAAAAGGVSRRGRVARLATAVAVLAGLVAARARRTGRDADGQE